MTIAPNVPPTVAITSAASFNLPAAVVLTATAADTDGVAKVEFFNGANKLGEATTTPFQFTWAGATAGTYTITARATDTIGSVTTSAPQTLVINPDTVGPWSTLSTAQKAGFTTAPDGIIEAGGVDAGEVMGAIGVNTVVPKFSAAMAQAARAMANFTPAPAGGFLACPGGGTMQSSAATATTRAFAYDNCVIGGFTFYGGGDLPKFVQHDLTTTPGTDIPVQIPAQVIYEQLSATSFRLTVEGVVVTGNGAPVPGAEAYPRNAIGFATVTCDVNGAVLSCFTNPEVNYLWGNDLSWSGYSDAGTGPASGALYATDDVYLLAGSVRVSHCVAAPATCRAAPPPGRYIRFEGMTNIGGRAIVYGANGYSVVTRLAPASPGVERMSVRRTLSAAATVNGVTYPVGQGPLEIWRCNVGAVSGDWGCQLEVAP